MSASEVASVHAPGRITTIQATSKLQHKQNRDISYLDKFRTGVTESTTQ